MIHMETLWAQPRLDTLMAPKWSKMFILSLLFHLVIFSSILFVPQSMPTRRISDVVYEVNLVEMPSRKRSNVKSETRAKAEKSLPSSKKAAPAKRISRPKTKEVPVVMAKRVVEKKTVKAKTPEVSPSKLIDQALEKIEEKVKAEKEGPVDQAISKLESRTEGLDKGELPGGMPENGITIRIYRLEIEERIKSNWSYPVALTSPKSQENLEAIVVIRVKNNGTILKFEFEKRSYNAIFDQSVLKAIKRSDPLPPFPEGYRKTHDEIEINFNLRDFERH